MSSPIEYAARTWPLSTQRFFMPHRMPVDRGSRISRAGHEWRGPSVGAGSRVHEAAQQVERRSHSQKCPGHGRTRATLNRRSTFGKRNNPLLPGGFPRAGDQIRAGDPHLGKDLEPLL